jgi:heat shock protein HslJ
MPRSRRVWLVVAGLLLAACAAPAGAGGPPPAGTPSIAGNWELVDGTSGSTPIRLPQRGRGTLSADATRVTGTAFCNGYGARYRLEGDRLRLTDLASTAMGCLDDDRTAAEGAFLDVLGAGGIRVTRTAGSLTLTNAKGVLHFRPQIPVPAAALVDTRWVLESLVDRATASSTVGEPALLTLAQDGTVSASTGCRALSGRWTASGDTVRLDYQVSMITCPDEVAQQDQHVLNVLGGSFRAAVDGDRLTLTGDDALGLVYRAQP